MERNILYYPTIDIPRRTWLRHALIYWDSVSSIVPKSWEDDILIELSPEIHYLMDEGQFIPVRPEDLVMKSDNWEVFESFQNEFKETVASVRFQSFIKRQNKLNYRIHVNKLGNNTSRIHANKTSDSILHFLDREGLAKRDNNNHEWLIFEKSTALLYMSLLAKYLADISPNNTTIGTDFYSYEKFNFNSNSRQIGFPVINFSLNNILPTPKENVPFDKIVEFKRKRKDNLIEFRKFIAEFQRELAVCETMTELKEKTVSFQDKLDKGVKDLKEVMSDSKVEHFLKSMKSLIDIKSPALISTVGTFLNESTKTVDIPTPIAAAGIISMAGVQIAANYVEQRNKQRAAIRNSPFSYVYYANQYGLNTRR